MFHTYIVASRRNGTLYTGHTDCLPQRIEQHQRKALPGFTARYGVDQLVWYEQHLSRDDAFQRERFIKHRPRLWKLELIETVNPDWRDLGPDLIEFWTRRAWIPPCAGLTGYMTLELETGPLAGMALNF